jgi:hypothetical protein
MDSKFETRNSKLATRSVTPAKAGSIRSWIPAYAGMTAWGGFRILIFEFRVSALRRILTPDF